MSFSSRNDKQFEGIRTKEVQFNFLDDTRLEFTPKKILKRFTWKRLNHKDSEELLEDGALCAEHCHAHFLEQGEAGVKNLRNCTKICYDRLKRVQRLLSEFGHLEDLIEGLNQTEIE